MFLNGNLRVLESLVDGVDLSISVHVQLVHAVLHVLLHAHAEISLDVLNCGGLVPCLFRRYVIRPSHPGHTFQMFL